MRTAPIHMLFTQSTTYRAVSAEICCSFTIHTKILSKDHKFSFGYLLHTSLSPFPKILGVSRSPLIEISLDCRPLTYVGRYCNWLRQNCLLPVGGGGGFSSKFSGKCYHLFVLLLISTTYYPCLVLVTKESCIKPFWSQKSF